MMDIKDFYKREVNQKYGGPFRARPVSDGCPWCGVGIPAKRLEEHTPAPCGACGQLVGFAWGEDIKGVYEPDSKNTLLHSLAVPSLADFKLMAQFPNNMQVSAYVLALRNSDYFNDECECDE